MNPNANVSLFNFNGHDVRVVEIDGEPWFRGADILAVLYGTSKGKAWAYRPLAALEITMIDRINLGMKAGRPLTFVSESGLYKMVMRSDKPEARKFQDWVTREVLPSIRKHGGYVLGQEDMTPEQFIRALAKFAGRKVAAYAKNGAVHLALPDLIAPLEAAIRQAGRNTNNASSHVKRFLSRNAPDDALSVVPMSRVRRGGRQTFPVTVVAPEALPAVLTYVTGKLNGVDFRTSFMKLPDVTQLEAA